MEEIDAYKNEYKISVEKPARKTPLKRPRLRWEDNIKVGLREIDLEGVDWIRLAQERDQQLALVNTVNKPLSSIKVGNFLTNWKYY